MQIKNTELTPVGDITAQMLEPRPLPMGRSQFHEWADRIISGALVSADIRSQKWALANMLIHLGPTESHKPDAFFIHSLRKAAVNETADAMRKEFKAEKDAEIAAQTEAESAQLPQ